VRARQELPGNNTVIEAFARFVSLIREIESPPPPVESPVAMAMWHELTETARRGIRLAYVHTDLEGVPAILQAAALRCGNQEMIIEEAERILKLELEMSAEFERRGVS
jgi:hypothetical protein